MKMFLPKKEINMKHLMKHIAMVAVIVALAAGAYMAYQHYSASTVNVTIQKFIP